jgi:1,4-alpha-glucan branching enzyme
MEASQHRTRQRHASDLRQHRRLPVGADVLPSGGVHFRVWASQRQHVEVMLEGGPGHRPRGEPISVTLEPEGDGYFSGLVSEASAGTLYRYRLDGGTESYPDVASRFQPHGPHGPSQVIDSTDWGQAINYADEHAGPVREFFITNAGYWIEEFHFDGLRQDATQNICKLEARSVRTAAPCRNIRSAPRPLAVTADRPGVSVAAALAVWMAQC